MRSDVLICGAGPTGLVLALWLTKTGVKVRIIDKSEKPGTTSRAIVIHARTLEFYHQMGIDQEVLNRGIEFRAANFWVRRKKLAHAPFGDGGAGISPYPYGIIFPQDLHEEMLVEELVKLGITIERNTELTAFKETETGVRAFLKTPVGSEECEAVFLAGCDGAHSIVRKQSEFSFEGGTYENVFYVADLEAEGTVTNGEMHALMDDADFLAIFPMKGEGRIRLVGAIKPSSKDKTAFTWEDVSQSILTRSDIKVKQVNWFSTYKVHHRVASHFRKANIFILGDAAHVHSPVGGQGMNTGIGDAVNLAWKIGAIIQDQAPAAILDTYEPERIAFARRLVATTDRAFEFVSQRSFAATQVRTRIFPYLAAFLFRFNFIRSILYKTLSQTQIHYRGNALARGTAGKLSGGDRLPWVRLPNGSDNYASLASMHWQVHCYGALSATCQDIFTKRKLPVHVFPWSDELKSTCLQRNKVYLIRPDGYIGLIAGQDEINPISTYLNHWNIGIVYYP